MTQLAKPFNVYVDESIQGDVVAVTAYIATVAGWAALEEEWQRILDHYEIPFFHMTDFIARQKQFHNDWTDERRDQFIERLCTTACDHTIVGIGCGISQSVYEKALPDNVRRGWKDPYYFCSYSMLSMIAGLEKHTRLTLPKPLNFLFDNRPKFEGDGRRLFLEYKALDNPNNILGEIAFGSKKEFKALQAADLLVYVTTKMLLEYDHQLESKMEKPVQALSRRNLPIIVHPTSEMLGKYVEFIREKAHPESS